MPPSSMQSGIGFAGGGRGAHFSGNTACGGCHMDQHGDSDRRQPSTIEVQGLSPMWSSSVSTFDVTELQPRLGTPTISLRDHVLVLPIILGEPALPSQPQKAPMARSLDRQCWSVPIFFWLIGVITTEFATPPGCARSRERGGSARRARGTAVAVPPQPVVPSDSTALPSPHSL